MVMKETKKEEPRTSRVQVNTREKPITTKATHQNKTMGEKKPVEDMSTDEEEDETMNIEEDVEVMEAKLSYKIDLIHAIVGRNLAKDNETKDGVSMDDKLKSVRQQGDELIGCLSEIVSTLNRLHEVPQEIE
ncbi:hypothetical protein AXX17_AT4G35810 [Arabidopsis thaliana]|jgi:flagellar biosynthesis component FlhA|nr:hypothetical protein AXX17_AT4G35810 [Arabidopsis thaliana]